MARQSLFYYRPPASAIAVGATLPDPGGPGVVVWSTVHNKTLVWDGARWVAQEAEAGSGDADLNYVHTQAIPSNIWVVTHGLGKIPAITVIDSAGDEVRGDTRHDSINQATLTFSYPFSGAAHCN